MRLRGKSNSIGVLAFITVLAASLAAQVTAGLAKGKKAKTASSSKLSLEKSPNANSKLANDDLKKQAMQAYYARDFKKAEQLFNQCVALEPRDTSFQYYLGVAALFNNDFDAAEHALCRVIVMSPPDSPFTEASQRTLYDWKKKFSGGIPYSQLSNGKLSRWEQGRGAIKVWVSKGLQLPRGYVGGDLTPDKCKTLYSLFEKPGFFQSLETTSQYVPQYQDYAKNGVRDWTWTEKEGLISIELVDDPLKADVLYFWCPHSGAGSVGRTFYPWSGSANARFIVHIETDSLKKWGSRIPLELRSCTAHEFGHVLGLEVHSHNPNDVMRDNPKTVKWREMSSFSNLSPITRNDYLTLRALYELPPEEAFVPRKLKGK